MALKALLTVDLENDVSSENRKKFNQKMAELNWNKITILTTTWWATFAQNDSYETAVQITKDDVKSAITFAKISKYNAAVQVGEVIPSIFNQF